MSTSSVKRAIRETCSKVFPKQIVDLYRKRREFRYRVEMLLFPLSMKVYCPCCEKRFRSFIARDFGERPEVFDLKRYKHERQDVLCPFCRSMPRHRILASWCVENKKLVQSGNILYFAPEKCMMLWMKRNSIACTTADLYQEADLKLDIQATGLQDESYDMIFCNHVLEHVDDFRVALKELHRIIKRGGSLICSFPMDPKVELLDEEEKPLSAEERLHRFGQYDHKRVFGMKAGQLLEEAGFAAETIKGEDYPEEILPVVGPADYDMNILFWCRKV